MHGFWKMSLSLAMAPALLLAGCGGGESDGPAQNRIAVATPIDKAAVPAKPLPTDAWVGKWIGVEGLSLDIQKTGMPGAYRLHMTLMEAKGDYSGKADGDVIRFTRDGTVETIRHTNGDATGLKWLAGKKDCLTVKEGVGFCRD